MPTAEIVKEAERQMTVCNSCRYCEGFCAVFPAMELRRKFSEGDLLYLANLCHDCRDCYYACQFAPPHQFMVNVPQVFAQLRQDTYRDYTWPGVLRGLFSHGGAAVAVISIVVLALTVALVVALAGPGTLFGKHLGEGAFYRVVPYLAMVLPASAMALYALWVFCLGTYSFWRDTSSSPTEMVSLSAFLQATGDAFSLRYLGGGESDGCNYPNASFSQSRRWFHHLVFYGFLLDLASTTLAAIYDHFLHWEAPYPLLSWPVGLGTVGGVLLTVGCCGLLGLKWRSDRDPAEGQMLKMDVAFLVTLLLTSLTGLLLLALRETPIMGPLLAIHLAIVAALFLTMPYGKFAHLFYRYAALVRNSLEQARAGAGH